ncbi:MAG: TrmO family methyltransferase [Hyphomicrobiales bacterium]
MKKNIDIQVIGELKSENGLFAIQVNKKYIDGLTNIDGFQHLQIVWWGHLYDDNKNRASLVTDKPYKKGPEKIGVFATRSEMRPNPILISTIQVISIDKENGIIYTPYIDAEVGTNILDIKPYHGTERIKEHRTPDWCSHWPKWYEESGEFNWQDEFNF